MNLMINHYKICLYVTNPLGYLFVEVKEA